jgi:signal transduction histidine kinase
MTATSGPSINGPDGSLGRMAHDLNNLMGVVLGFTEMILRDLDPDDPHRDELLEIKKAGEGAVALAARFMDMARSQREP